MKKREILEKNWYEEQSRHMLLELIFYTLFILIFFISLYLPEHVFAGTGGTEFQSAESKVTDMIGGGLGRLIAVTSLAFALIGSVLRFNPMAIAGSLGIGLTAGVGTAIVKSGVTALI